MQIYLNVTRIYRISFYSDNLTLQINNQINNNKFTLLGLKGIFRMKNLESSDKTLIFAVIN